MLDRASKNVIKECLWLLSQQIREMDKKTESSLYFVFEDLINETFGTTFRHGETGKVHIDGEAIANNYTRAYEQHLSRKKEKMWVNGFLSIQKEKGSVKDVRTNVHIDELFKAINYLHGRLGNGDVLERMEKMGWPRSTRNKRET